MRRCRAVGLALLGAVLGASAATSFDATTRVGPVEVRISLSPDEPVIGDAIELTIEAIAENGVELLMPEFGDALDRFRIIDFVPRERLDDQGRTVATQRYTLRAPRSGEHSVPPLLIEFVDRRPGMAPAPEGADAYELLTEPLPFSIASLVVDAASADLAPPLGRLGVFGARARPRWPWILGGAVALVALLPLGFGLWRRLSARAQQQSAYQLARQKLDDLAMRGTPVSDTEVDDYFVELSSIVRHYLENRFALRSPELTTERFIEQVSGSPDLRVSHQEMLRDFLREADLVKFAHHVPTPETMKESLTRALQFVEETRDAPAAATSLRGPHAAGAEA